VAEVASGTSAADDPSRPNIARVYDYLLGGNSLYT
jgi:hypothetical protein